jgi:hypothetical protein
MQEKNLHSIFLLLPVQNPRVGAGRDSSTGCWPPPPLSGAKAGRNHLKEHSKNHPSSPLASGIAKPYQIYVKLRSCADLSSPYKWKSWTSSVVPLVNSLLWGFELGAAVQQLSVLPRTSTQLLQTFTYLPYTWTCSYAAPIIIQINEFISTAYLPLRSKFNVRRLW